MNEKIIKKESIHMKDFTPPWQPSTANITGFRLPLSDYISLYAEHMTAWDDVNGLTSGEKWIGYVLDLTDNHRYATITLIAGKDDNVAERLMHGAWAAMFPKVQELRKTERDLFYHMQRAVGWPDEPLPVKPVPDVWYPADRYVPDTNRPVIVAWRDNFKLEHGGDRTAIYKNGTWHWAFGEEELVPISITITDWTACPDDPNYPYYGESEDI